jgi:hypothetical protein
MFHPIPSMNASLSLPKMLSGANALHALWLPEITIRQGQVLHVVEFPSPMASRDTPAYRPTRLLVPVVIAGRCTYKCIDSRVGKTYSVLAVTGLCDLNGTNRKTGETFRSTMFALKRLCSFLTIPTLLPNATSLLEMRSDG